MKILGREEIIQTIGLQVRRKRLVSIVGPAGVGKTTVALALGEQLLEAYSRRVCFVDLATLEDPAGVPSVLATVMGLPVLTDNPLASVVAFLRGARVLIILDNCEHVISAAGPC